MQTSNDLCSLCLHSCKCSLLLSYANNMVTNGIFCNEDVLLFPLLCYCKWSNQMMSLLLYYINCTLCVRDYITVPFRMFAHSVTGLRYSYNKSPSSNCRLKCLIISLMPLPRFNSFPLFDP